ncbi:hypothetical protein CYMTET_26794 [Cymbomonas tetramitiformis]|uniref:Uncharacterized protein n=1 Tax=Cymbomonas tetramitiformis TaxID=36881 RepID=A0AAE0FQZ9_9CHLO|nr:hypothetical protein CYMTET_26794 [Cymbomonas tetramitiformis]
MRGNQEGQQGGRHNVARRAEAESTAEKMTLKLEQYHRQMGGNATNIAFELMEQLETAEEQLLNMSMDTNKLTKHMEITMDLIRAEVVLLTERGLGQLNHAAKMVKQWGAKNPYGDKEHAFKIAYSEVKRLVLEYQKQIGVGTPRKGLREMMNLNPEQCEELVSHHYNALHKRVQELVVAYDVMEPAMKREMDTAQEVVANCMLLHNIAKALKAWRVRQLEKHHRNSKKRPSMLWSGDSGDADSPRGMRASVMAVNAFSDAGKAAGSRRSSIKVNADDVISPKRSSQVDTSVHSEKRVSEKRSSVHSEKRMSEKRSIVHSEKRVSEKRSSVHSEKRVSEKRSSVHSEKRVSEKRSSMHSVMDVEEMIDSDADAEEESDIEEEAEDVLHRCQEQRRTSLKLMLNNRLGRRPSVTEVMDKNVLQTDVSAAATQDPAGMQAGGRERRPSVAERMEAAPGTQRRPSIVERSSELQIMLERRPTVTNLVEASLLPTTSSGEEHHWGIADWMESSVVAAGRRDSAPMSPLSPMVAEVAEKLKSGFTKRKSLVHF